MTGRILVCGGRMYGRVADDCPPERMREEYARALNERDYLYGVLLIHKPTLIIHGGADGADEWAGYWAKLNSIPCQAYRADWRTHGKAAGPFRNQRMLDDGKPDLVIAFPGGRGTADMVRRARKAGIAVREVAPASCGTRPKGGDANAAPALPSDAVGEAQTPNLSRPIPDTLNAGGCE